MAKRHLATIPLIFGLVLSNFVSTLGNLGCEDLPVEDCAFSVASSGTRCVLEKYKGKDDFIRYECQSSIIMAEKQEEWIESDECVKSCGLERMTVGLSTDLLMDSRFAQMLCSSECLNNCPNLIDLYISLAAGEGVYLPQLCKTHRMTLRRVIPDPVKKASDADFRRSQLLPSLTSSGAMASGSKTPLSGSGTPDDVTTGPDFRGYGGGFIVSRGELEPTSPVSGISAPPLPVSSTPPAPAAEAPTISTSKQPFFVAYSALTSSTTQQSNPVAATPETIAAVTLLPESSHFNPASSSNLVPEPSPEQAADFLLWQQQSTENLMPERQQLNDDEYLYETYFH